MTYTIHGFTAGVFTWGLILCLLYFPMFFRLLRTKHKSAHLQATFELCRSIFMNPCVIHNVIGFKPYFVFHMDFPKVSLPFHFLIVFSKYVSFFCLFKLFHSFVHWFSFFSNLFIFSMVFDYFFQCFHCFFQCCSLFFQCFSFLMFLKFSHLQFQWYRILFEAYFVFFISSHVFSDCCEPSTRAPILSYLWNLQVHFPEPMCDP